MLLGVLLGILTALLQACAYLFMRKSLAEFPESVAFFMNAITGLLIWVPFGLYTNGVWADVWSVLPFALVSAILSEAFVFFALARGDTIISGVLFSTYPIFTIIIAYIFLGESLLLGILFAIVLAIVGTLIVSAPSRQDWKQGMTTHWRLGLVAWPLVAALACGAADVAGKFAIDDTSAGTFLIALGIAEVPVGIAFLYIQQQNLSQFRVFIKNFSRYKYAFLSGLLSTLTLVTFWFTFEMLPASIASPITATTPVFVFLFGWLVFKEQVSRKNMLGLTLVMSGIILLSVYGI